MDKIDRYILRQFVQTFFFAVLAFAVIYIAVNLMENLDEFFDRDVPNNVIAKYYMYLVPDIVQLVVPIAMLLAGLFTVNRMEQSNEFTAVRAAGRSIKRIAMPLLAFGLIVSGGMIYFNGWIVPRTNKEVYAVNRKYLGRDMVGSQRNVYLRISPTLNLLMEYFDPTTGQARRVSLERFDTAAAVAVSDIKGRLPTTLDRTIDTARIISITERADAESMRYDSTKKQWILQNGIARSFEQGDRIAATPFVERPVPGLPITPEELNLSQQNVYELTLDEHRNRIAKEAMAGQDLDKLWVEYYSRLAFPFSAFIVVFFSIPFSSAQRKGGAAAAIAVTGLITAIYFVLSEVSKAFTYGGDLHPAITAWMANGVFLIVGIANLIRVERG